MRHGSRKHAENETSFQSREGDISKMLAGIGEDMQPPGPASPPRLRQGKHGSFPEPGRGGKGRAWDGAGGLRP